MSGSDTLAEHCGKMVRRHKNDLKRIKNHIGSKTRKADIASKNALIRKWENWRDSVIETRQELVVLKRNRVLLIERLKAAAATPITVKVKAKP